MAKLYEKILFWCFVKIFRIGNQFEYMRGYKSIYVWLKMIGVYAIGLLINIFTFWYRWYRIIRFGLDSVSDLYDNIMCSAYDFVNN